MAVSVSGVSRERGQLFVLTLTLTLTLTLASVSELEVEEAKQRLFGCLELSQWN